ncbi:MAG: hypothetical protein AAF560_19095 [Acidobacteriota bacterium]
MYPAILNRLLAIVALSALWLSSAAHGEDSAPSNAPWLDDLIDASPLAEASELELVEWLATALAASPADARGRASLPPSIADDRIPRMVFASVSDGQSRARVFRGAGRGVAEASQRLLEAASALELEKRWIKIDWVRDVVYEPRLDPNQPLNLPRSLFGLALETPGSAAFLPEELVVHTLVNNDQLIQLRNISRRPGTASHLTNLLSSTQPGAPATLNLYRFSTSSYFFEDGEIVPLYRGHRRFGRLTPELLLETAVEGGAYLTRAVGTDGRFAYSYLPKTDEVRNRYNILRHAGTIFSMMELYEVVQEPELLAAAERAIGYLQRSIQPCTAGEAEALCVVEDREVKLGGNGLAIVALAKYAEVTGKRSHGDLIAGLGKWILATQGEDGEFKIHKQPFPSGPPDRFRSQYYPGEALLALLRGGEDEPSWLEATARGARWLIEVRDRGVPTDRLNHDHWLLYALDVLHRRQPHPLYLAHASRITQAMLDRQNRRPAYLDWLGSYYRPPRSTPTATRSEGLTAAYQLERDFGSSLRADKILEAIELGTRFQLQTQFRPESALYVADPQRILGGFRRSLENYEIRIDYVQHNISALLALRRILLAREAG